jgi:hypothetical protein
MSIDAVQPGKWGSSPMKILPFIAKLLITSKRFSKLVIVGRGKPWNDIKLSLHKKQMTIGPTNQENTKYPN